MSIYSYFVYLFNSIYCCKYGKKHKLTNEEIKNKEIKNKEIKNKATQMLNDWKVDTYANNRFLHKIPEERSRRQYRLFLKELEDNNL